MTEENPMNEVCTCTHRQAGHMETEHGVLFHGSCVNSRCNCEKYTFKTFINPWGKPVKDPMSREDFKRMKKEHQRLKRYHQIV
jgi:hypothetical protein